MSQIKLTTWNVENLDILLRPSSSANGQQKKEKRKAAIAELVDAMSPDILCIEEGPTPGRIDDFTQNVLDNKYVAIKIANDKHDIKGTQWIWFLVKPELAPKCELLPPPVWDNFTSPKWEVHYWGDYAVSKHDHYRHPQVLVFDWHGQRVEFIGVHLKSKRVSNDQEQMWLNGGDDRREFILASIKNRIKLATEATNVRAYIDAKFDQVENPAIFVMGDMNDGPGHRYFERHYLFFDLASNIQGDVFFARKFLNHALFDFEQSLRWSTRFRDFIEPHRPPELLLDHILFTQGLVDGSLPLQVEPKAGFVEHEKTELVNSQYPKYARTSDHRPVSVIITTDGA